MIFYSFVRLHPWSLTLRSILIMKLIILISLLTIMQAFAEGNAQTINLTAKHVTLNQVMHSIQKQSGLNFFLNGKALAQARLSVNIQHAKLKDAMDAIAAPLNLDWVKKDEVIILKPKRRSNMASATDVIQRTVRGRVVNSKGEALTGTTISVKGTTVSTNTDQEGRFSLQLPPGSQVLVFSNVGYQRQEKTVNGNDELQVVLQEEVSGLDEVVVVGYGSQKRANVIGAVSTVSSSSLENRSTSTLSSSLSGLAAGVNVQASTGKPGADGANILIRGRGTLNNTSPLVVIDGIVGSMDAVNPNDVESISILKDAATAAIYGSLGSNGVILITTKKGAKGKNNVSYTGMVSMLRPNNVPEFVTDYARHMRLVNEGFVNLGQAPVYTDATIGQWEEAKKNPAALSEFGIPNEVAYPNTDWGDVLFGQRKLLQNHNLSLNGGTENTQYLFSVGYFNNPGTMPKTGADKIRMRVNLQSKVAKFLTVGTQTFGDMQNLSVADVGTAYAYLTQTVPGVYPYYNGVYGFPAAAEESATANNALASLNGVAGKNQVNRFNTTIFAKLSLMKGLEFESKVNYNHSYTETNSHQVPYEKWNFATNKLSTAALSPGQITTQYGLTKSYNVIVDNVLRYNGNFGQHDVGGILGYNEQYFNQYTTGAAKLGLVHPDLTTFNSATSMSSITGDEADYGLRSFFGRLNYAYANKYLAEAVMRYDGSSRFGSAKRWGFFPAFSAGWRISEEPFMAPLKSFLDDLRIRASWGKTGNNASGDYDHLPSYGAVNYSFNNQAVRGLAQTKLGNDMLHWETTATTNLGFTASALQGKLNVEFDIYRALTDGILYVPNIPAIVGTANAATMNIAEVSKRGLELTIGYQGRVNDFKYSVSGNFAYNSNRVEKYKGALSEGYVTDAGGNRVYQSNIGMVSAGGNQRILEGHEINEFYLYNVYRGSGNHFLADGTVNKEGGPRDGMIRTEADMEWLKAMVAAGYSFQPADGIDPTKIWYGDLIYSDLNGDGIYGNVYDQKFMGKRAVPAFNYGLSVNLGYKNFDASMIWSASSGVSYYWNELYLNSSIVAQGKSVPALVADDHYYYNSANPADPNNRINGYYPRLKGVTDAQNGRTSDFYLYNAAFVKLRNLQIGYTLPESLASRFSIAKLRLYVAGENLLTWTKFPGLDPEIGPTANYPTMRQYSLGLNLTF
ncbi:Outer membrane cobalamin receptor protein [Sphingobacterium thalpophilum]|uniref:Outer membrane cobalamin receptor protein n=2 Tax=Sphingobacterium thalpophilum TaxID=259 RepID=A0A4U9VBJ0_9SPHI|nr:Outer membrane cobalamin receptor protein [Sphingobacterium thalpophilum]